MLLPRLISSSRHNHNRVRLIGIGFDIDGYEEFKNGNYFAGEIYIDKESATYTAMGLKTVGVLPTLIDFITRKHTINAIKEAKALGIDFNMKNNGM